MRMIAGLDAPTSGRVRVDNRDYRMPSAPMAELGILLEAKAVRTGRSARNHLLAMAQTNGISRARIEQAVDMMGLREVAGSESAVSPSDGDAAGRRCHDSQRGVRRLHVQGLTAEQIDTTAWQANLPVFELSAQQACLEKAFMELTHNSVDYRAYKSDDAARADGERSWHDDRRPRIRPNGQAAGLRNQGHAGPGHSLGADEVPLAVFDRLEAARRDRLDDRHRGRPCSLR